MSTELETNRRTLMKMGAWSVPVIAVAAATPAAAASEATITYTITGTTARYTGQVDDDGSYIIFIQTTLSVFSGSWPAENLQLRVDATSATGPSGGTYNISAASWPNSHTFKGLYRTSHDDLQELTLTLLDAEGNLLATSATVTITQP
ncbi:hypothetical protein [Microbacterium sp. MPKO10]|uniref:hypothetical protein n=1 Tax=Microbacterium sp. MPKO10 TaxID=2989818 RepID=UPI0022369B54|nr:hypothetical protein [Microbacterium sp. MPKO10]MCW4456926.1 hypothetical protein [Microbacterium sp. MPKO10]